MMRDNLVLADIFSITRTDKGSAIFIRPKNSPNVVPIIIGSLEAQSIIIGSRKDIDVDRPLTHDLILKIFKQLKLSVECVNIDRQDDAIFYATIVLLKGNRHIKLDSRPSDALGILARVNCPLYINKNIVENSGVEIDSLEKEIMSDLMLDDTRDELQELEHQLTIAIKDENYEEAARIRDKIRRLQ